MNDASSAATLQAVCEAGGMHGGLDFDLLAAADARVQGLPEPRNTEGFVVLHRGEVAFEGYCRGRLRMSWPTRTP